MPDLVSVQDIANAERKTKQTILYRIKKGTLPARRAGQEYLVLRSDML